MTKTLHWFLRMNSCNFIESAVFEYSDDILEPSCSIDLA